MNKLIKTMMACLCVFMVSCGGSSKTEEQKPAEFKVKPENTQVKGGLAGCFEVVDKEYTMKKEGSGYMITVELKRTDEMTPFYDATDIDYFPNAEKTSAGMVGGFGIELLDKDGNVIETQAPTSNCYSWDDMVAALRMNPGETGAVTWKIYNTDIEPASFRITSDVQTNTKRAAAPVKASSSNYEDDDDFDISGAASDLKDNMEKELNDALSDEDMQTAKDLYNTGKALIETEAELMKAAYELSK